MTNQATQSEMQLGSGRRAPAHRLSYWRLHGDDWTGGTRNLSFEQKGFYIEVLNALFDEGGRIPACERWLAKRFGCDVRVSRRLRDSLIAVGKLRVESGYLVNRRMSHEVAEANKARAKRCGTVAPDFPDTSPDIVPKNTTKSEGDARPTRTGRQDNRPSTLSSEAARAGSFEFGYGEVGCAGQRPAAPPPRFISEDALDRVRSIAPGWDRQFLHRKYLDWSKCRAAPNNMDAAFLGWVARFTKGRPAS